MTFVAVDDVSGDSMTRFSDRFATLVPFVGLVLVVASWGIDPSPVVAALLVAIHFTVVVVAVAHAEAIAHRVGEPFGTLVLAVAVTVIEVALIVTLMATEGDKATALARDTVFAAIMIVCNGVVGLALVVNARKQRTVRFSEQGANALLGTLMALATLSLVMPTFTKSSSGATFSPLQLTFAAVAAVVVYGIFLFVQTIGHRWMFLAPDAMPEHEMKMRSRSSAGEELQLVHEVELGGGHRADATSGGVGFLLGRLALLVVSLAVVIGLAKTLAPSIEDAVVWAGAPQSFVGVVIALMVLLPESIAAFRAAARNEMQTSINLALGSGLASIGLTIPAIAVASIWLDTPITLGLGSKDIVLLALTAIVSILTFGSGRATILQATHHLVVFAAFIFLAFEP